jgi:type II secretory ATPase GspE/PulE/Tfp pilus assembly ATPase PilB-like protein
MQMAGKDGLMGRFLGNAGKFTDKQVAETLSMLVMHGIKRGASDIHIEPHERFVLVRYRIDGVLRGVHKLPRSALVTVMAQLKTLADLHVQETQTPQEGQYVLTAGDKRIDVRVSTMPVFGGEKAVLHLSLERGKPDTLDSLGFWGTNLTILRQTLASPHGLIVVAGPRHSGVSSTLFSLLDALNTPMVGIATVEAHAKHRLPGVSQTYIGGTGMTMLEGLQATLKQDPNIVMLADISNAAAAELAIHTATTGHLVLTGLHASGSISAALRLRAAGVEPFMLVAALRASVGQRLVRQLCPNCRERYELSHDEQKEIARGFGINTAASFKRVHDLERSAAPAIFGDVKQLSSSAAAITHLWRASDIGCDQCDRTGYNGRTAIVEVLSSSENLHKMLLNREVISAASIQAAVLKDGFIPMALDGLVKALRGQTTITEVLRAVSIEA